MASNSGSGGNESPQNNGIIYLLENEAFTDQVIKIGRTGNRPNDLARRIRQLNTGVPLPFKCYRASLVDEASTVERLLHDVFYPSKRHWRGEFYEVEPWRVMLVLQNYELEDMTRHAPVPSREDDSAIEAVVKTKERRSNFTFAEVGIEVGQKLGLVNSDMECEVADQNTTVFFEGKRYALSTLASKLMNASYPVQGVRYWEFEGETLLQRRNRIADEREIDAV